MNLTPDPDVAWCVLAVKKALGGGLAWSVVASLPDAEPVEAEMFLPPTLDADCSATWVDNFHSESKAWRSLLECVAADWAAQGARLF